MTAPLKPRPPADPEAAFDAAVGAAPLRPPPPGLARAVMARVRGYPVRPRFRLSWLDVALCGLGGAMVGVLLLLLRALATPQALAQAQNALSALLLGGGPQGAVVLLLALVGAVVVAGALLIAAGVALVLNGSRR